MYENNYNENCTNPNVGGKQHKINVAIYKENRC
jgi:hypothetical protein